MRLRPFLFVILLVGGFWFLTTHAADWNRLPLLHKAAERAGSASGLELTEAEAAPAYDAEEQNNIAVYKRVLPSVVNITAKTLVSPIRMLTYEAPLVGWPLTLARFIPGVLLPPVMGVIGQWLFRLFGGRGAPGP